MAAGMTALLPWEPEEFVETCKELEEVVKEVGADLVVADCLFSHGLTVCQKLGVKYLVLSPNTLKEFAAFKQPWAAVVWKYPM